MEKMLFPNIYIYLEKKRQPEVFWCFQEVSKRNTDLKFIKVKNKDTDKFLSYKNQSNHLLW